MTRRSSVPGRIGRVVALRCAECGRGRLFRGPFAMAPGCEECGCSFRREPGFFLGSIYINYGVTSLCAILLYAGLVAGLGSSHETALAASLVVAVVLPVALFRWARAILLAVDASVNAHQPPDGTEDRRDGAGDAHLARLRADDGNAGCLMGIVLALVLLFGLVMGGVTLYAIRSAPRAEPGDWDAGPAG